jgi:2-amino-4-hydroxy-6-hydroxymethyldihydropteridine diphosphokinase
MKSTIVLIMLGGNLGDTQSLFEKAKIQLMHLCGTIKKQSELYRTEPWGISAVPLPFLNQVVEIETKLEAESLLSVLLNIEINLGRKRNAILNEPRTIDLDILYFGNEMIDQPNLQIPHPRMHLRRFVLEPLAEKWPQWVHPKMKRSNLELWKDLEDVSKVEKLANGL